ncbi:MAG: hypothetical protein WCO00_04825 [Rhodospirillaceae bacterium]
MSIHANAAVHYGHGFGFEPHRVTTLPDQVAAEARSIVTNNGRTTVRKQLMQAALLIGFVSELFVLFIAFGW